MTYLSWCSGEQQREQQGWCFLLVVVTLPRCHDVPDCVVVYIYLLFIITNKRQARPPTQFCKLRDALAAGVVHYAS